MLDIRTPAEFGEGHVPGALNVWIDSPQFANRAGLFVPADAPLVLVAGGPDRLTRAVQGLGRIGLDEVAGHLQWGMGDWRSQGLPVGQVPQISVHDLATMREEQPDLLIIDVREPFEWDEGHIDGAVHLPDGRGSAANRGAARRPAQRGAVRGRAPLQPGHQRARAARAWRALVQRRRRDDGVGEGRPPHGEGRRQPGRA